MFCFEKLTIFQAEFRFLLSEIYQNIVNSEINAHICEIAALIADRGDTYLICS